MACCIKVRPLRGTGGRYGTLRTPISSAQRLNTSPQLPAGVEYADAIFNLALLLQRKNEYAEAGDYWRRYLDIDCQSEWTAPVIEIL